MSLLRQGSQFVVVGVLQLALDWLVFVAATALGVPVPVGNVIGRISGAILGFVLNGRVTFARDGRHQISRSTFVRFLAVWIPLTLLSTWLVALVAQHLSLQLAWLAKPVVEGALAVVSFVLWRHLVFR